MNCLMFKKSNCKNCYKCIRHCPVKAIRFYNNQAYIVNKECILCGKCVIACPQDAKQISGEIDKVTRYLRGYKTVIACLDPSFTANYETGIEAMREALLKLGFYGVEDIGVGAELVKNEYERILSENDRNIVISSQCHSINLMIQKYYPDMIKYLADVISPMQAVCVDIKRRHPECKVVYIGPCISKKDEAQRFDRNVDAVLTFAELSEWLDREKITVDKKLDAKDRGRAGIIATSHGILDMMDKGNHDYSYIAIDGVDNCLAALEDIAAGSVHKCFIEMSACTGGCVGGPVMENERHSPLKNYKMVRDYAGTEVCKVEKLPEELIRKSFEPVNIKLQIPEEEEIRKILIHMGKRESSDELNCGSCGYNTCRDKAIAIYNGKADVSTCLPYLKEKAESFTDSIINNTPNGIVVLDEELMVQQINRSALKLMNITYATDVIGDSVDRIIDSSIFENVIDSGEDIQEERIYLTQYRKHVDMSIVHDREYHLLICIMRDVTEEENVRKQKEDFSRNTIEIADKVVDRQMRIVQEIASLLGETAAETKIALTKLKESIEDE